MVHVRRNSRARASGASADGAERSGLDSLKDPPRGERLQRVLAAAGLASRRDCEAMIEAGRVRVNGRVVTDLPIWVDPGSDRIEADGRPISKPDRKLYVVLNKPVRTLTSVRDEPGADRRTVTDLVDHPAATRLFPVGRLDYDTVGLVLLTNDGELANRLTHPRYGVPKTYRAVVRGRIDPANVEALEQGIYLANRRDGRTVGAVRTNRVEIRVVHVDHDRTTLDITLREGRNRQVRRMLAAVELPVKKLERVAMGPLPLKGIARGEWRELSSREVNALRKACGMRHATKKANPRATEQRQRDHVKDGGADHGSGRGNDHNQDRKG
ncbi:MAG: pseudouridine synthase [Planctomycetota bacterium]